ncbi:MAG: hypothetical protein WC869_11085 [Phycisphaerae bacterium]|jgi:hypothetical protein
MAYDPSWTNSASGDRLVAGVSPVRLCDVSELAAAINRRRQLTYQAEQVFTSLIYSGAAVRRSLLSTAGAPPFNNFRANLLNNVLSPPTGSLGGEPPTPAAMNWLWPVSGSDENKIIVAGTPSNPATHVSLLNNLNAGHTWTDGTLTPGVTPIRAVHVNELRQVVEWLSRGRWELPIYFCAGLLSALPDASWFGEIIANTGDVELQSVGYACFRLEGPPILGLTGVTVRSGSYIEITADTTCQVSVARCATPVDWENLPTWNNHPSPVGIGSISLTADQPGRITGSAAASALQAIVDGAPADFIVARTDTGDDTIGISGRIVVEFDLATPPN